MFSISIIKDVIQRVDVKFKEKLLRTEGDETEITLPMAWSIFISDRGDFLSANMEKTSSKMATWARVPRVKWQTSARSGGQCVPTELKQASINDPSCT